MKKLCLLLALLSVLHANAAVVAVDDSGNTVTLTLPAQRIITLAPHATELVFAAGGGDRIVGTVGYSDYPAAALQIPRIGNHQQIDIERIISLKPDLLIAWRHGNSDRQLDQLRRHGIPVFLSEPKKLNDIPDSIERLGVLIGTQQYAARSAASQRNELARLTVQYADRATVSVFYQIWSRPLQTLNGAHIISDIIRLCGGMNIFSELPASAPTVSVESVLLKNPEVIMTGAGNGENPDKLDSWRHYRNRTAVKHANLFAIDADLVSRAGPRMIKGAVIVCEKLELARSRRPS